MSLHRDLIFKDDFTSYPLGQIPYDYTPLREYHFYITGEIGPWKEATTLSGWRQHARGAWSVIEEDGRRAVEQSFVAKDKAFPLMLAGESHWDDYTLEVHLRVLSSRGRVGIAGRVKDSLNYYTLYVEEGRKLVLAVARTSGWTVLREVPCTVSIDAPVRMTLRFEGSKIRGSLEGAVHNDACPAKARSVASATAASPVAKVAVEAEDTSLFAGGVGIWGDVPARFYDVSVWAAPKRRAAWIARVKAHAAELEEMRRTLPQPQLWKRIDTPGFGAGRTLRFGDLDGDGRLEIVLPQNLPRTRGDSYAMISCITAVTLDGEILWQVGEPSERHGLLTNDLAIQLYDLDGDGRDEVIYAKDFEIRIADGLTGKTLKKAPTPSSRVPTRPRGFGPEVAFDRIVGDAIFICNVRGLPRPQDILIKDRYNHVWVYDDRFELLWSAAANTGHYPFAMDVDGDGCDELFIGDSLFDHDGRRIWSLELARDHVDTVAVADLKGDGEPRVILGASDEGLIFADLDGRIIRRHMLGHVQMGHVANLDPDRPGLEVYTITFWGHPGIITVCDSDGEIVRSFAPMPTGSHAEPLNWTGDGTEFILFSTSPHRPGVLDGYGRNVLNLPGDGHPDLTSMAIDLTGDPRDEIVTWDTRSIWIYTQDREAPGDRVYAPRRLPHYNMSNYRAALSLPGWAATS